jgi:DNA repair protein RadC
MRFEHTHIREVRVQYPKTEHTRFTVSSPKDIADFVRTILPENSREHFFLLYMDVKNQVTGYSIMGVGGEDSCPVPNRELFQRALIVGAINIAIAHNHPSGSLQPSASDWSLTARIVAGAALLGIRLLDHVIVTENDFVSLQEQRGWSVKPQQGAEDEC